MGKGPVPLHGPREYACGVCGHVVDTSLRNYTKKQRRQQHWTGRAPWVIRGRSFPACIRRAVGTSLREAGWGACDGNEDSRGKGPQRTKSWGRWTLLLGAARDGAAMPVKGCRIWAYGTMMEAGNPLMEGCPHDSAISCVVR